jgi:hypothetical protein
MTSSDGVNGPADITGLCAGQPSHDLGYLGLCRVSGLRDCGQMRRILQGFRMISSTMQHPPPTLKLNEAFTCMSHYGP